MKTIQLDNLKFTVLDNDRIRIRQTQIGVFIFAFFGGVFLALPIKALSITYMPNLHNLIKNRMNPLTAYAYMGILLTLLVLIFTPVFKRTTVINRRKKTIRKVTILPGFRKNISYYYCIPRTAVYRHNMTSSYSLYLTDTCSRYNIFLKIFPSAFLSSTRIKKSTPLSEMSRYIHYADRDRSKTLDMITQLSEIEIPQSKQREFIDRLRSAYLSKESSKIITSQERRNIESILGTHGKKKSDQEIMAKLLSLRNNQTQ